MTKPSRKENMNAPDNEVSGIVEKVKKLQAVPNKSEKTREEIRRLIKEWAKVSKSK